VVEGEEGGCGGGLDALSVGVRVETGVSVEHGGEGFIEAVDGDVEVAEGREALGGAEGARGEGSVVLRDGAAVDLVPRAPLAE
jgi:hypothetical protein